MQTLRLDLSNRVKISFAIDAKSMPPFSRHFQLSPLTEQHHLNQLIFQQCFEMI